MRQDLVYQPVFCHNCGINLNPLEDIAEDEQLALEADTANCGWCGRRHSYAHIKVCRYLANMSETSITKGIVPGLLALRERLQP